MLVRFPCATLSCAKPGHRSYEFVILMALRCWRNTRRWMIVLLWVVLSKPGASIGATILRFRRNGCDVLTSSVKPSSHFLSIFGFRQHQRHAQVQRISSVIPRERNEDCVRILTPLATICLIEPHATSWAIFSLRDHANVSLGTSRSLLGCWGIYITLTFCAFHPCEGFGLRLESLWRLAIGNSHVFLALQRR